MNWNKENTPNHSNGKKKTMKKRFLAAGIVSVDSSACSFASLALSCLRSHALNEPSIYVTGRHSLPLNKVVSSTLGAPAFKQEILSSFLYVGVSVLLILHWARNTCAQEKVEAWEPETLSTSPLLGPKTPVSGSQT